MKQLIKQFTFKSETEANQWLSSDEATTYNQYDFSFDTLSNGNIIIEFGVL